MLATTLDPDGRRVHLTRGRWDHIRRRHPILADGRAEITAAVRDPVVVLSPGEHEAWFYGEDAGRFPWIKVVVHYEGGFGWIWTAFPVEQLPRP